MADQNERIGEHINRVEMDVDSLAITILECRPPWDEPANPNWIRRKVARLRYTASRKEWSLYWPDRNSRFHLYDHVEPTPDVERLLTEIDADPTCIFWG